MHLPVTAWPQTRRAQRCTVITVTITVTDVNEPPEIELRSCGEAAEC